MITAKNINKSYGDLQVLKDVTVEINPGEVVSIVGASGAGKTTLLQILGTLDRADSGSILYGDVDVTRLNEKELARFRNERIGFVFQAHHLLPEFSALENVMIPALIGGEDTKKARARAMELLETVGLQERVSHKPSQLSGGEQQRVAIARSLVNNPAILFADEPTGNLDSRTKEEIHRLFFDLRKQLGQTIVIVTHDAGLAELCDRTCILQDGAWL